MEIKLYWLDTRYRARGYANNLILNINTVEKSYALITTYAIPNINERKNIEVKRKSDILDYVSQLKADGYKENKELTV